MPINSFPDIVNLTCFRGDDLKHFVQRGLKAKGAQGRVREVRFCMSHHFLNYGLAYCDATELRVVLSLARGFSGSDAEDLIELAQIFEHEVDHILGLDHPEMWDWWTLPVPWMDGFQLRETAQSIRTGYHTSDYGRLETELHRLKRELERTPVIKRVA